MAGYNFVERVHAYSKWLLGLESEPDEGLGSSAESASKRADNLILPVGPPKNLISAQLSSTCR
ncbi:MAG: hypothetical protein JRN33_04565 [Nitrososphaerota archaeon]|jgi:hypothetical protein|nr:hypothetical protein [Nitrososphaerota archaeon]MDG6954238.1 hypothetical protein [Nitrososphaerota archaeon]